MKILSSKKQLKVMDLIFQAQMYAREDNFMKITDCLADIAGEVLTLGQLCFLKDAICGENKKMRQRCYDCASYALQLRVGNGPTKYNCCANEPFKPISKAEMVKFNNCVHYRKFKRTIKKGEI